MTQHPSAPGSVENHPLKVVEPFLVTLWTERTKRLHFGGKYYGKNFRITDLCGRMFRGSEPRFSLEIFRSTLHGFLGKKKHV